MSVVRWVAFLIPTQARFLCNLWTAFPLQAVNRGRQPPNSNKSQINFQSPRSGPPLPVNRGRQSHTTNPTKPPLDHWHTGCKRHARREATTHRIHWVEQTNLMKANTTRNLASVVMLVILSPFLALAILVSIKSAGIRDNEVLLLLLTLSSAVLSGINGFGRRTSATPLVRATTPNRILKGATK